MATSFPNLLNTSSARTLATPRVVQNLQEEVRHGISSQHQRCITGSSAKSWRPTKLNWVTVERLSSGLRITRSGDDAADWRVETLRAQIRSINQANRNAGDGISLTQVADGAAATVGSLLSRMRELATQSASGRWETTVVSRSRICRVAFGNRSYFDDDGI